MISFNRPEPLDLHPMQAELVDLKVRIATCIQQVDNELLRVGNQRGAMRDALLDIRLQLTGHRP